MSTVLDSPEPNNGLSLARPAVVKLGGSVVRGNRLAGWLETIAAAKTPIVVVPGGGALADEVRHCQSQLGFGDQTAHRMALLAMDQLAWAIAGMRSGFEVGTAIEDLRAILERGHVAVWAPAALIADRNDVEASWRLTSDSLALWLAGKLDARCCGVVKSAVVPQGTASADTLMREGLVDDLFPAMLAECGVATAVFGQDDEAALASYLKGDDAPHRSVVP